MGPQAKQKLERTAKPLIQWKRAIFYSLKSGAPPDKSSDHAHRPSPSTHAGLTSNPLVPTFFLLAVLLLIGSTAPVKHWLTNTENLPSLTQIFSVSRNKQPATMPKQCENVSVWTKKQFGFYYCEGGVLYGSEPGKIMTQADALTSGYRPADGQYCGSSQPIESSDESLSFQFRNWLIFLTNRLPSRDQLIELVWEKHSAIPKADEGVSVWANKHFGFYYCQNSQLFGKDPGELMTQADALMSGYQPATGQYCGTNNPN